MRLRSSRRHAKLLRMKFLLLPLALILACLSTSCLVHETVTEHTEVISDGYKVKEPFHKKQEPEP